MADNGIIQQYAAHLERKASGLLMRWTLGLGFVGGLLGAFPFLHISHGVVSGGRFGLGTVLLGALAGAYLGYTTGERKAIEPRMQAQLALHQLQVEQSLIGRVVASPVVASPVVPAVPVAPAPVPAPVPVAPPAPAPAVYYKNCDAARAAGAAPVHRGDPGYDSHLDRDGDGIGCEN